MNTVYEAAAASVGVYMYNVIIPNYNQQDATFLDLFISTDAHSVEINKSRNVASCWL